jgi:hypothetical protein
LQFTPIGRPTKRGRVAAYSERPPGFHGTDEVLLAVTGDVVALQADGTAVSRGGELLEKGLDVELAAVEGLDETIPFALVIGAIDADQQGVRSGLFQASCEICLVAAAQPMAEIEDNAEVGASDFLADAESVLDGGVVKSVVGIEGYFEAGLGGEAGDFADHFDGLVVCIGGFAVHGEGDQGAGAA